MKCQHCHKEMRRYHHLQKYHSACAREAHLAKNREYMREYYHRPDVKAKRREYMREYYHRPDVKAKHREYQREYRRQKKMKEKLFYENLTPREIEDRINRIIQEALKDEV